MLENDDIKNDPELQEELDELNKANDENFDGLEWLDIDEVLALKPPTWLVDGLLTEDSFAVLYGAPGTYKSFFALGMALCIAHGLPWCGRDVIQGAVAYVAAEGKGGMSRRYAAWLEANDPHQKSKSIGLIPSSIDLADDGSINRTIKTLELKQKQLGEQLRFIVIDTLARCMPGSDENSAKEMGVAIKGADRIQKAFPGCCLLLIHHCGKDRTRQARGSNSLEGACTTMLELSRAVDEKGHIIGSTARDVSMHVFRQKEHEAGERFEFCAVNAADSLVIKEGVSETGEKAHQRQSDAQLIASVIKPGHTVSYYRICEELGKKRKIQGFTRGGAANRRIDNAVPSTGMQIVVELEDGTTCNLSQVEEGKSKFIHRGRN